MEQIPVNFGGQSNSNDNALGVARFVNCFLDVIGEEGKAKAVIKAHDGLTQKANESLAPSTRGLWAIDSANLLWVADVLCFHVDSAFNVTVLGGIPGTGPVTFGMNRKKPDPQVMIAGDGQRFLVEKLDGEWALNKIEDTDLLATHSCDWVDGYFLAFYDDGRWGWSSLDEGTTWASLDRAAAESDPDKLVRGIVYNREVHLLGAKGLETWTNTGSASVFERTGTYPLGCKARHSAQKLIDGVIFVANDDTVRAGRGLSWRVVSTPEIERKIEDIDGDELRSWSYKKGGREFYALASDSWVFELNLKTGLWNERESFVNGQTTRWRGEHYAKFGEHHIFGDDTSTKLYAASEDVYDEAGEPFTVLVQSPPQHSFPGGARFHALHVDVVPGVGLNSTDDFESDPQLALQWSDDGGQSWSNELTRTAGQIGEYDTTVRFDRLGITRKLGRTWRLSWSAPVVRTIAQVTQVLTRLAAR